MNDNFSQNLADTTSGATGLGVGMSVATVGAFVVAAIPTVAGFLFLKDRWYRKGRSSRSKKTRK